MTDRTRLPTLCVHAGQRKGPAENGLNTPIVTSTAYDYTGGEGVRYPRYLNTPNHQVVAAKIAALEGAEDALVSASGLGSISALLFGLLEPGDHVILLDGLYGGTSDLIDGLLVPWGLRHSTWDGDPGTLAGLIEPRTRLAWVESPTNPLLRVIDLAATAAILNERGVLAAIDNTFATPILQRPLALGFDLVMHSATKYFGGHSDLLCGALAGSAELIDRIRPAAIRLGSSLNGQDLALLERSMKTLALRVERQSASALELARSLAEHAAIAEVYYPGLPEDPGHAIARRQMDGFGGMLGFRLAGDRDPGRFLAALEFIAPAVSLAGVESTICQPSRTSHARVAAAVRERLGIDDRLMRLSVGIESLEDLVEDLGRALGQAG
ncbi:PLP-dependent transferase [Wenzhouxiangella sp. XN79A]|uniref:trans-sulfuration enzyme family protein n=1 Tax=Wenzhouxiangella sp. XN79A TaxID=2724193 RepID=UPI00144A59A7|nr:PLP-dependent aspartate aminotransferase family protein [Wenzhouxiangella sp. XN79A]NKI36239.1 PLP-dependent transferase [Wenzhouxiangella sp. XN79A]